MTPAFELDCYAEIAATMLECTNANVRTILESAEEMDDIEYLTETLRELLTPKQIGEILLAKSAIIFLWGVVFGAVYIGVQDQTE